MRCLVTGASGTIGAHLLPLLLERGAEVGALLRPDHDPWRIADHLAGAVTPIHGSLGCIEQSAPAIRAFAPEVVFHLGWHGVASRFRDDPEQVLENVVGSVRLMGIAAEAGCRRWVGLGSQAELGVQQGVLDNSMSPSPRTVYGAAKFAVGMLGDHLSRVYAMEHCWLRLLAVYGPMDDPAHLIPYVTLTLLRGGTPSLTGGEQRWDYLYARDAAEAIWTAGTHERAQGSFLVGSGQAHRVRDIACAIRDLVAPSRSIEFGERPYRADQPANLEANSQPFREATGWTARTDLATGLPQTVAWYADNLARFPA